MKATTIQCDACEAFTVKEAWGHFNLRLSLLAPDGQSSHGTSTIGLDLCPACYTRFVRKWNIYAKDRMTEATLLLHELVKRWAQTPDAKVDQ